MQMEYKNDIFLAKLAFSLQPLGNAKLWATVAHVFVFFSSMLSERRIVSLSPCYHIKVSLLSFFKKNRYRGQKCRFFFFSSQRIGEWRTTVTIGPFQSFQSDTWKHLVWNETGQKVTDRLKTITRVANASPAAAHIVGMWCGTAVGIVRQLTDK